METLHSEGYNLRPLLSFGPALTLGISSLTEYFDVRVPVEWKDFDAILKQLQDHSEPGIIFKNIAEITSKTPSIQDAAQSFTYFLPVKEGNVAEVVKKISESEKIVIQSFSKKEEKHLEKDIRPMMLKIEHGKLELSEKIMEVIDEVSPCRTPGIFVTAAVTKGSSIRPSEILEVFAKEGLSVDRPIKVAITL
jgi:radical SAM-linked protein